MARLWLGKDSDTAESSNRPENITMSDPRGQVVGKVARLTKTKRQRVWMTVDGGSRESYK